ncbi:MAG: cyclase family protein [Solirubrobacteraceae bacterium]
MSHFLSGVGDALVAGSIDVIDLTQPLSEETTPIKLPEPLVNTPGFSRRELSHYDERGPQWAWNAIEVGEHVGTHLDAPIHWYTGRDGDDLASIPAQRLVGPAVVLDKTREAAADPDYLVTRDDLRRLEAEHGPLPKGGWLLLRTGWDARAGDEAAYLNIDENGSHTPGFDAEAARWLGHESPLVGVGVETVGTDAGNAARLEPPFPLHHFLAETGKLGVTQLANLALLPVTGSLLVVAPMKIVGGTGSPTRVLALVAGDAR